MKFVILLQQYISTTGARPSQTQPLNLAKPNKDGMAGNEDVQEDRMEQGNSLFVKFLMIPSLLREILEITKERLLI